MDRKPHHVRSLGITPSDDTFQILGNYLHCHLAGDLTGGVPTHAVGYDEHPLFGEHQKIVLVACSDYPNISAAGAGIVDAMGQVTECR
jgi:hypothetical protein